MSKYTYENEIEDRVTFKAGKLSSYRHSYLIDSWGYIETDEMGEINETETRKLYEAMKNYYESTRVSEAENNLKQKIKDKLSENIEAENKLTESHSKYTHGYIYGEYDAFEWVLEQMEEENER